MAVTGLIAGGAVVATASTSNASPALPPMSARQLLVKVQTSPVRALSGTVHEAAALGLPSLPNTGGGSSASLSWQSLIAGTHDARVWVRGVDQQRVALLGQLSEAEIVHNGRNLWTYTSATNTVTHTLLPQRAGSSKQGPSGTDAYSPQAIADQALKAVSPTTAVSVARAQVVAGRDAYTLLLRPRDTRSTVREVAIAIDARTFVPLQVAIFGTGSTPAFQVGFSSISYARPAESRFAYTPPAGATVSTNPWSSPMAGPAGSGSATRPAPAHPAGPAMSSTAPRTIGHGWTTVIELGGRSGQQPVSLPGGAMLKDLTTRVGSTGERLLHTALINAVVMPDGRIFAGAVRPAMLEHVAATAAH